MHTRYVNGLTIRPLRNGDVDTVASLFDRLGAGSRQTRFCAAKPRLLAAELAALARVDADHHVLVAHVGGDPQPAGIARLVRRGAAAEVAFEVADAYQGRGDHGARRDRLRRQPTGRVDASACRRVTARDLAGT